MIKLAVAGANGRTGRLVVSQALGRDDFELAAALVEESEPLNGKPVSPDGSGLCYRASLDAGCDVLVEFTLPAGTMHWLEQCLKHDTPMVICSTGHDRDQMERIGQAASEIPLLKAPNTSVGIAILNRLVDQVARLLPVDYDIEIVETHHRDKVDAPSGTADMLLETVLAATGRERNSDVTYDRSGKSERRPAGQIGMHSLRLGGAVGTHEVHFGGREETLILKHRALSREMFARGALLAAKWLAVQPAGYYTMENVLFAGDKS